MGVANYSVLIVGCGRVAGGPFGGRGDGKVGGLSHAAAIAQNERFNIVACVDPSASARQAFQHRWDVRSGYSDLDEALSEYRDIDIACICSPDETHEDIALKMISAGVKAVVLEKPAASTRSGLLKIVDAAGSNGTKLLVNFPRRYAEGIQSLKRAIQHGELGEIKKVVGVYNKGFRHNGVHHIDLVDYLFGPPTLQSVGASTVDYEVNDPTVDAVFRLSDGATFHLLGTDCRDYAIFDLTIYAALFEVKLTNLGFEIRYMRPEPSKKFPGFRTLVEVEVLDSGLDGAFAAMYNDMAFCLDHDKTPLSDATSSLVAAEIYSQLDQSSEHQI